MSEHSSTEALLEAVNLATKKLSTASQIDAVLHEVLTICCEAASAEGGTIYLHNKDRRTLEFRHVLPEHTASVLKFTDIPDDFGVAGQVFQSRTSVLSEFEVNEKSAISEKTGVVVRTMATVPLMLGGEMPIGVVQLINKRGGIFNQHDIMVLETVGAVSTLSFLNSQLLEEQTRASQLLGMGRVAHDIKNMAFALEANLSFSDDTVQNAREYSLQHCDATVQGYVDDIGLMIGELRGSIDRIKRYSALMSDLSAGKELVPTLTYQDMGSTVRLSAAYMESEARSRGVALMYEIDDEAEPTLHDEMYLFRIVQNLVSNAIKAVAEHSQNGGTVIVRYRTESGKHIFEVQDSGPGMPPEVVERILLGQAKSVWSKSAGSGWGTKIVLELAKALDGELTIDSTPGQGSIFRVTMPHLEP